jgi:uncharacterized protein YbcI
MSSREEQLQGGRLLVGVSDGVVRLLRDFAGKGPTTCKAYWAGPDILVVMLSGGYTTAEQTLFAGGHGQSVRDSRMKLQDTLAARLSATIEELTGRKVVAFMNASHQDPDLSAELFVLEPQDPGEEPLSEAETPGAS